MYAWSISLPFSALACSFAIFFVTCNWLLILALSRSLSRSASFKPYLENVRPASPVISWHNKWKWVFFSYKSHQEKMAFLSFPIRITLIHPFPLPRVCTDGPTFARSYGDVMTKFSWLDGFTNFSKEWGSARAPSVRRVPLLIILFAHTKHFLGCDSMAILTPLVLAVRTGWPKY